MRVLVTGAGGYLGGAVVRALLAAGHEPVALARAAGPRIPGGVEVRLADLRDDEALLRAVRNIDAVIHLAGLTRARVSWDRPLDYFDVNVGGTVSLLRAMQTQQVSRLVFASTGAIYGCPEQQPMSEELPDAPPHPYASSKAAAESVIKWQAQRGELAGVVLRLFNVAGGMDPDETRIVPRIISALRGADALTINGDGSAVRDYLHISDAAAAFVAALAHLPDPGSVNRFNIGSGVGSSIADLIAAAERVATRRVPVVHQPPAAEPRRLVCNPSRALAALGWQPNCSDLDSILRDAWNARD